MGQPRRRVALDGLEGVQVSSRKAYEIFHQARRRDGLTWDAAAEGLGLGSSIITYWKTRPGGINATTLARLILWSERPLVDFLEKPFEGARLIEVTKSGHVIDDDTEWKGA